MPYSTIFRLANALTLVATITLFGCGCLIAQNSGGDFSAPVSSSQAQASGVTMSFGSQSPGNAPQKKSNFNKIPFRINGHAGSQTVGSNNRHPLRTAARPTIRLNSPSSQPLRKIDNDQNGSNKTGNKMQLISPPTISNPASKKIPAKPVKYSPRLKTSPTTARLPQQTSLTQEPSMGSTSKEKHIDLPCTVTFIDDIRLPAQVAGVIASLAVKEGDSIKAGMIVGRIDNELTLRMSDQAKVRYNMALESSKDTTGIRAAEKKYQVAGIEAAKTQRLALSGSKSDSDRMMAVYTKEISAIEREKAVREQQQAMGEKLLAAAQFLEAQTRLKQHIIRCDYNASVIQIFKKPQEYVQPGEEVMRVARMDRLWVQGTISIADQNPSDVMNRPVTITATLAHNETVTFEGKITNVSLEAQGLTRYLVKAEVENRPDGDHWVLHPMSRVDMRIHLDGDNTTQGGAFDTVKQ